MKTYALKLEDETHKRLKVASAARGMTMQEFVLAALEMAIDGTDDADAQS